MRNRKRDDVRHSSSDFVPDWASPPGDTLAALLEEQSMSQTELAERLGVTLKHVNRVVKGAASISADLALGLEKVFGAPASFWMTREAHFQADRLAGGSLSSSRARRTGQHSFRCANCALEDASRAPPREPN